MYAFQSTKVVHFLVQFGAICKRADFFLLKQEAANTMRTLCVHVQVAIFESSF